MNHTETLNLEFKKCTNETSATQIRFDTKLYKKRWAITFPIFFARFLLTLVGVVKDVHNHYFSIY